MYNIYIYIYCQIFVCSQIFHQIIFVFGAVSDNLLIVWYTRRTFFRVNVYFISRSKRVLSECRVISLREHVDDIFNGKTVDWKHALSFVTLQTYVCVKKYSFNFVDSERSEKRVGFTKIFLFLVRQWIITRTEQPLQFPIFDTVGTWFGIFCGFWLFS